MKLTIEKVENGFVCEMAGVQDVIQDKRDEEKECLKELLMKVAEYFGYTYDKFGSENLKISFDGKGHKIE